MSTSLRYHAFGIPTAYTYKSTHYEKGCVTFVIEQRKKHLRCSSCDSRDVILRGSHLRQFKTSPIGEREVYIELAVPRLECRACQCIRQAKVLFANGSKRYTKRFRKLVLSLSMYMTIKGVASYLRVGWDLVKEIQKEYLKKRYNRPSLRKLKRIAIDEVYMGKKMGYLTVVLNLQTGVVVYVGKGKSGDNVIKLADIRL